MVMIVKLKHIDELAGGRKRFRRRWPKDVGKALGESFLQRPMAARDGAPLVTEHAALMKTFEATVAAHRRSDEERARMSPRQLWEEAQVEAERLTSGIVGDVEAAEDALAEDAQRNADPLLYRAIKTPNAEKPKPTLADAFTIYADMKIDDTQGRHPRNRLDRVRRRLEKALGPLNRLPLEDLKRADGRKLLDMMKKEVTSTGKLLATDTITREINTVASITKFGLFENDLPEDKNPFRKLEVKRPGAAPAVAKVARLPLPPDVIAEVRHRLTTRTKRKELLLIWRLVEGTGCRPSEIGGLRVEDVYLDHETPHIRVWWHEDRRLKTVSSHRLVPIVGDALGAVREAVGMAKGGNLLFAHYAGEAGAERLSKIMNQHVRKVTKDPRHVFYSLRHNMKDKLVASGADQRLENVLLGHTVGGVGDRNYGTQEVWLERGAEVLRKAVGE